MSIPGTVVGIVVETESIVVRNRITSFPTPRTVCV